MARRTIALMVALVVVSTIAVAEVPTYSTFELQARSNITDGFNLPANSSFNSKSPALGDDGTIAFTLVSIGGGNAGLFIGSGGIGAIVYTAPTDRTLEDPSLNANGEAAFDQADIFSDGIYVYDPVSGNTDEVIPAVTFATATRADITDDGGIGYRAGQFAGAQSWRLWDATETTIVSEGGGIAFLFVPSTNDLRHMAGKVRLGTTSGSSPDEIRLYDEPGSFVVLVEDDDSDPTSPYVGFDNGVDLAPDDLVAFIADLVGGDRGVFLTDGTTTITIATEASPDVSDISFFRPVVNGNGLVAFRGTDAAGLDAIFVGDGTTLRRVVGEHDLVPTDLGTARIDQNDNSVVFGGNVGINARGDIAFNAALTPEDNNQIEWGSGMFIAYVDAAGSPPPVPDGSVGTPMTAARHANGIDVNVSWDVVTCPASDYNLFFGDLAFVSSVTIDGAVCGLGTSGEATFTPPAGDVFFVVASESTDGVESGHGTDHAGAPRPSDGIGLCGITAQSLDGTCP
jgi:hypothetical protein